MTATYQQIEDEAHRRFDENPCTPLAHYIIEVVREGWTPPEPVEPDVLAYRKWEVGKHGTREGAFREEVLAGKWDRSLSAIGFLAGARMAREEERKRKSGLVATMEALKHSPHRSTRIYADVALKLYNAGRADHD
jgi:hypothetical protein